MMTDRRIRRLFWDIETSPNVVLSWRIGYKLNIDHANILKERAIICICYKWEGENEVHALTWDGRQNDRAMLKAFLKVAEKADELVAHNGDRFDIGWFRTRCLYHGLDALPPFKTVDTLKWARRAYLFNSNRLDYIARFLHLGGKLPTGFGLWKRVVLEHDSKALEQMVAYCKQDVALLEKVWAKLRLANPPKSHAGVQLGGERWHCPHCASDRVKKSTTRYSAVGVAKHQMQCKSCRGYYNISPAAFSDYEKS